MKGINSYLRIDVVIQRRISYVAPHFRHPFYLLLHISILLTTIEEIDHGCRFFNAPPPQVLKLFKADLLGLIKSRLVLT